MITDATLKRLNMIGTPVQKAAIGRIGLARQEERNASLQQQLDARDKTAELQQRLAYEPPATQAARDGIPPPVPGQGSAGQNRIGTPAGQSYASYAPRPQSGIGTPARSAGPQGNFERARDKGPLTSDQIAQASQFAAAHGRAFDPDKGYSTNTAPAATAPTIGTPANPPTAPSQISNPPSQIPDAPTIGTPAKFTDKGEMVVTPRTNDPYLTKRIHDDKLRGFALGTAPGETTPTDQPFVVGEDGPEIIRSAVPLTVTPNPATMVSARRAPIASDQIFTQPPPDTTRPAPRNIIQPSTPQWAFPSPTPISQSPSPSFIPTFAAPTGPPPGVRRTDHRRFMRSPQGVAFAEGNAVQSAESDRRMAQHQNFQTGLMQRDAQDRKQQKQEEEAQQNAAYDQLFGALTTDKTALPPVFNDLIGAAKTPKAKAALHDLVLNYLGHKATSNEIANRQETADKRKTITGADFIHDPTGTFGLPMVKHADGSMTLGGGALPLPKPVQRAAPAELLKSLGDGYEVATMHDDGSYTIRPKKATKAASTKTMIYHPEEKRMHEWDTTFGAPPEGWVLPQQPMKGGSATGYLGNVGLPKKS